jgi:hypothetical protein
VTPMATSCKQKLPDWFRGMTTIPITELASGAKRHMDAFLQRRGALLRAIKAGDVERAALAARCAAHRVRMLERHHSVPYNVIDSQINFARSQNGKK